ncbi:hypothetical protein H0H81_004004 [Sphagnurus paluster]|uniref:Uncharacterized protein n=1 Tax=Sphagnurus paluster TaxID=117069 RepID=A0A9P7K3K6_9AGAR|nr:hypothetical protein H0H81_004004 [Sphagnurus paluster]
MPAGGSPQPISVDPDGSTPTRAREAVLQHPHSAPPARSVGEVIAAKTNSADLQGLYESLKLLTATVVEVARTQDIILAPPQAATPPPTPELAQVLAAVQALSQKVTKLETAALKPPPPPKPAAKPSPGPTFLSAARTAANKPQPPPPPPKPAAKR